MSIFALNSNSIFPNTQGILNQELSKILFVGSPVSLTDIQSGIFDGCQLKNISHIESPSNKIELTTQGSPKIQFTSPQRQSLNITLDGFTESFNSNVSLEDGMMFLDNLSSNETTLPKDYKIFRLNKEQFPPGGNTYRRVIEAFTYSQSLGFTSSCCLWSYKGANKSNLTHYKRTKFLRCNIQEGFYKRPFFDQCVLDSNQELLSATIPQSITKLRIISSELSGNNKLKKVTLKDSYLNSSVLDDCFINSSTIESSDVIHGTIYGSSFLSGTFSDGIFLENYSQTYSQVKEVTFSSWRGFHSGKFSGGIFEKSIWFSGEFLSGDFYDSDWISGTFTSGTLGREDIDTNRTTFGNLMDPSGNLGDTHSSFIDGIVKGAIIGGSSSVDWYSGIFNSGEITSGDGFQTNWYNGTFNSGKITGNVIWRDGDFKGGLFSSEWGTNNSDLSNKDDYSWQGGKFWAGQFGSGNNIKNSSWYDGEFRGGIFLGKLWREGLFFSGEFIGGFSSSIIQNERTFMNYFTGSYWGVWLSGQVIDNINDGITSYSPPTSLSVTPVRNTSNLVNMKNLLWVSGTFSHSDAQISNSSWIGGNFIKGVFKDSLFNPFCDKTSWVPSQSGSESFTPDDKCIWTGGNFDGGKFWYSQWRDGNFISGTMTGGIWHRGTWLWGFAQNILWKSGRWRNGNWRGTTFNSDDFSSTYSISIVKRVNDFLGTSSNMWDKLHYMNVGSFSRGNTNLVDFNFSNTNSEFWTQEIKSFPTNWILSSNIAQTTLNSGSFSQNLIPQVYRCSNTGCNLTNEVFSDINYFYRIQITSKATLPSSGWIFIDTGSFIGTQSSILSSGNIGYWNGSQPSFISNTQNITQGCGLIHLSESFKEYTIDIGFDSSSGKTLRLVAFNNNSQQNTIQITDIKIYRIISEYNTSFNNKILHSSVSTSLQIPFTNSPTSSYLTPSRGGQRVGMNWGNGQFLEGIWENGIWENGYRDDQLSFTFSQVSNFRKINDFTYRMNVSGFNLSGFTLSDRVSISNIIGIGTNFEKILLKSPSRVVQVHQTSLEIEVVFSGLLRGIEKDSELRSIKITKNIWQNGIILSGYFTGIMSGGLAKGSSQNLILEDLHLIDGILDGGTLRHKDSSRKSLVQNFTFYDASEINDIHKEDPLYLQLYNSPLYLMGQKNRKYNSHIDLDWDTQQVSNTFDNISFFSEFFDKGSRSLNHSSWTTGDILRSTSYIRSVSSTDIKPYSLGSSVFNSKEKIPNSGKFDYPTLIKNGVPLSSNTSDLGKFLRFGWTYSFSLSNSGSFISGSSTFSSNWNQTNPDLNNKLIIEMTGSQSGQGFVLSNFSNNNTTTQPGRYSMVEFEIFTYSGSAWVNLSNYLTQSFSFPKIYFWNKPSNISPRLISGPINHLTTSKVKKREFFYNLDRLDMSIFGGSDFTSSNWTTPDSKIVFSSINYFEVDSIPFFNYYLDSTSPQSDRIDRGFKTPNTAIAPRIDYSKLDFDFIGNVNITQ